MLAADAELERLLLRLRDRAALLAGHLHEAADADGVDRLERILLEHALLEVRREERTDVVAAVAEGHLREVVGAVAEEVGDLADLVGGDRGARDLDHGADRDLEGLLHALLGEDLRDRLLGQLTEEDELLLGADERVHDLGTRVDLLAAALDRGLDDGADLHLEDLGVRDRQAATAVTEHRVRLVELRDAALDLLERQAHLARELGLLLLVVRNELVERRIEQAHRDGQPVHRREDADEVGALERQQLRKRLLARLGGLGEDHLADRGRAVAAEEHVLGAAEADADRAELTRAARVLGAVGVGAHLHVGVLRRPLHDLGEVARDLLGDGRLDGADHDLAGRAVDREHVVAAERAALHVELAGLLVDRELARADDAALAPADGDDGRVARLAAGRGEDADGAVHAGDVLGARLLADEEHLLALVRALDGLGRGERERAGGGSGRRADAAGDALGAGLVLRREERQQELRQVARGDALDRGLLVDQLLLDHLDGDADGGLRGALAGAGLQHEELAVLDGELDVLHVLVVLLELGADLHQVRVRLREALLHHRDRLGGADAGDDVLALRVHEELAVEDVLTRGVVAGEGDAGAGVLAHVAVGHRLHVDRGAVEALDLLDAAVLDRAVAVPRAEHGLDGVLELQQRVLREVGADLVLVDLLVLGDELDEAFGRDLGVFLDAVLGLDRAERVLELVVVDAHDDVAEHVDQAAVRVVGEARVARALREALDGLVGEAEVEDGVHHAGHRDGGAGAHADEQRVRVGAELLAELLLEHLDVLLDIVHQALRQLAAAVVVGGAGVGGDGESGRNGQADRDHVGEVRALAAEEHLLAGVALALRLAEVEDHLADRLGGGLLRRLGGRLLRGLGRGLLAAALRVLLLARHDGVVPIRCVRARRLPAAVNRGVYKLRDGVKPADSRGNRASRRRAPYHRRHAVA